MKKIFLFAAVALSLTACNNDDNLIDQPVAAKISASISGGNHTRASETSWDVGDQIGVTMVGRYQNIVYTTTGGDGKFEGNALYFKNKREPVNLVAYYPFSGTEGTSTGLIEANTSGANQNKTDQAKFDFLFAKKDNVTGLNPEVKFDFSHQMSQITLIFKDGTGMDVSKIKSYQIDGLVLEGSFNAETGVCATQTDVESSPLAITLSDGDVVNEEEIPSLIIFPQTVENATLKITDNENQEYSCILYFGADGLEAGNNYCFSIKVNKTALIVEDSSISDWNKKTIDGGANSVLPE